MRNCSIEWCLFLLENDNRWWLAYRFDIFARECKCAVKCNCMRTLRESKWYIFNASPWKFLITTFIFTNTLNFFPLISFSSPFKLLAQHLSFVKIMNSWRQTAYICRQDIPKYPAFNFNVTDFSTNLEWSFPLKLKWISNCILL